MPLLISLIVVALLLLGIVVLYTYCLGKKHGKRQASYRHPALPKPKKTSAEVETHPVPRTSGNIVSLDAYRKAALVCPTDIISASLVSDDAAIDVSRILESSSGGTDAA